MISKSQTLLRMLDFENAVKDCTGGQYKVKKSDYLTEGQIPIIDQGQSLIAGFTNDSESVYSGDLPVILFGDHTLILKYIDFPFALGADGVKVLSINKGFEPKYLYYFWQSCQIPSRGYSRHFKFLREIRLPLIPLSEQRRIVEILDQGDALRKKRADADSKAARILPALFYKMFGDPVALALSHKAVPLGQLYVELQNGFACGEKDVAGGVPHLRMNNIDDAGVLNLDLLRTVPEDRDEERYRVEARDVLFMGTNSEDKIGKTCVFYPPDDRHYLFSNHLIRIRVGDARITSEFLASFLHLLWEKKFYPSIAKRWVNQASVAQDALVRIRVSIPSKTALDKFTKAFKELLFTRANLRENSTKLETTFHYLLHRAFTGDLTDKWREARMEELLVEMEAQTKYLDQ